MKALIGCYFEGQVGREHVRRLNGSLQEQQASFLVRPPHHPAFVLRANRSDSPTGGYLEECAAGSQPELARGRVATLLRLEALAYPAPGVVRARDGELVATVDGWCAHAVTYVDGTVIRPTLDQLRLLGAALGRLHNLPPREPGPVPGRSWWHPGAAVPATRRLLEAARPLVPPGWRALHAAFTDATESLAAGAPGLPYAITHNDAWPRNCVQTGLGQVTLIDWDTGGLGLAVMDLGRALLECHLDSGIPDSDPAAWHIRPDPPRIAALCRGYRAQRVPGPAELGLLAHATGFGIAVIGARHLYQALCLGIASPAMDGRLARLRNRLAAAAEITRMAKRELSVL
jgi:Ser/Thr protein kinase RdoA (MazF antagonist)